MTEYSVLSACNGLTASLCQWFSITSMFIHLKSSAGSRDPYTENLSQLTIGLLSFVIFYSALIHSSWATGKKTLTEVITPPPFPWYLNTPVTVHLFLLQRCELEEHYLSHSTYPKSRDTEGKILKTNKQKSRLAAQIHPYELT